MTAALARAESVVSDLADYPIRWSILSQPTPAHMRHQALHGKEPTAAMKLGTAGHAVTFDVPFEVFDVLSPKTGEITTRNSKAWKAFAEDCKGRGVVPLMPAEYDKACRIRDAIRANRDAESLLFGPGVIREQVIHWIRDGRACSSTPDARKPGDNVTDLKIVRSAAPRDFPWAAKKAGYPGQLVMYREADCFDHGHLPDDALACMDLFNVAVESAPPHAVQVYRLDIAAREFGAALLNERWEMLRSSEAANYWPAYSESVITLVVPDGPGVTDEDDDEIDIESIDPSDPEDRDDQEDL